MGLTSERWARRCASLQFTHRLAQDGSEFTRRDAIRAVEVNLVVLAALDVAILRDEFPVQADERGRFIIIGAEVQLLQAQPFMIGLEAQIGGAGQFLLRMDFDDDLLYQFRSDLFGLEDHHRP